MTTEVAAAPESPDEPRLDEQPIRDILRQVIDPEAGMNIVGGLGGGFPCAAKAVCSMPLRYCCSLPRC